TARTLKDALDALAPVLQDAQGLGSIEDTAWDLDAEDGLTLVATDCVRLAIVAVPEVRITSVVSSRKSWNLRNVDMLLLRSLLNGDTAPKEEVAVQLAAETWSAGWGTYRMTA